MQVETDRENLEHREERKGIWLAGSETVSEKKHWVDPWMVTLAIKKLRSQRNALQRTGNTMENTELVVTFSKDSDQVTEEMAWWPTLQSSRKSNQTAIWSIFFFFFPVFSYESMSGHFRKSSIFKHFRTLLDGVLLKAVNGNSIQISKK